MIDLSTITDTDFDACFPKEIRLASAQHWSPVQIARRAAAYLAPKAGTRVLDIGSGPGKFCLLGAGVTPGYFTGVEQRSDLHQCALSLATEYRLLNVYFINANITNIDFKDYEAFYYANSFYENVLSTHAIDGQFNLSEKLFNEYTRYMHKQLEAMPKGTRLATLWEVMDMPHNYVQVSSEFNGQLNLWKKV